jgi:hypothetical protein
MKSTSRTKRRTATRCGVRASADGRLVWRCRTRAASRGLPRSVGEVSAEEPLRRNRALRLRTCIAACTARRSTVSRHSACHRSRCWARLLPGVDYVDLLGTARTEERDTARECDHPRPRAEQEWILTIKALVLGCFPRDQSAAGTPRSLKRTSGTSAARLCLD